MGVTDAPAWLLSAFVRSCLAAGATAPRPQIEEVGERLIRRWQEPGRRFHDLRHVVDVLARVDELAEETHRPDVVRLAAWYHGAVFSCAANKAYAGSGGEDEKASADLARAELSELGVPAKVVDRVHRMIVNLRRHGADHADVDCLALCDADLATLAVEPQRYEEYRRAIREEYSHIPLRDYLEARIAIISRLLGRRNLFLSPMGAQWEEAARENLTAELDRLRSKLAGLGPEADQAEAPPPAAEPAAARDEPADREQATDQEEPAARGGDRADRDKAPEAEAGAPVEPSRAAGPRDGGRPPRAAEPRLSSLESVPEELEARPAGRGVSHAEADAQRARRAERAQIAQRGRERVEQAMRERRRADRPAAPDRGTPPARAGVPGQGRPPTAEPTGPDVTGETEEAVTPAPQPDAEEVETPKDDGRSSPDRPGPSTPTHGIERVPDLLDPRRRRRARDR